MKAPAATALSVADLFAINALVARYPQAMDGRRWDDFAALWTPDALFTLDRDDVGLGAPMHGPAAITQAIAAWLGRLDAGGVDYVRHVCGHPLLEVVADGVTSSATFVSVHHDLSGGGAPPRISRSGVYSDLIVRWDGSWRIKHRHLAWDGRRDL